MKGFQPIEGGIRRFNYFLYISAGVFLFFILLSTTVDVIGRYLLHNPIPGTVEMAELSLASLVFLAWAHTQAKGGHVSLDLIYERLPAGLQGMLDAITSFLGLFVAVLVAQAALPYVLDAAVSGEYTDVLRIPVYPIKFLMVIGMAALFFQFILESRDSYRRIVRPKPWK